EFVGAVVALLAFFFFFSSRRRHTRSTRDWSSDVCSSDLKREKKLVARATLVHQYRRGSSTEFSTGRAGRLAAEVRGHNPVSTPEIGRASCRERGAISAGAV